jgi:recombinational DNA repair protein (RecF pathway)
MQKQDIEEIIKKLLEDYIKDKKIKQISIYVNQKVLDNKIEIINVNIHETK